MRTTNKPQNQIIIYEGDEGQPKLEVRFENETVWLNQAQLVELFQSSKANISEHIKNIYLEKELIPESTVFHTRCVNLLTHWDSSSANTTNPQNSDELACPSNK